MERHTYKLCELLPKEPGKRGRHKRVVLMDWHDLPAEEVERLRSMVEPRLQPNQVSELDSKIVARGRSVQDEPDDEDDIDLAEDAEEAAEPADEPPQHASGDLEDEALADDGLDAATNPVAATKFSIRMLWLAQRRHAEASEELCKRTSALTDKTLDQWKKVDDLLTEVAAMRRELLKEKTAEQTRQASGVSMQDIMEIMRTGATIWREVNTPPRGGPSEP
jgi:hypothetical protein